MRSLQERLEQIRKERELLKQRRELLEAERAAKIELIKEKLGLLNERIRQGPTQFAAEHPILTSAAGLAGEGAVKGTKALLSGLKKGAILIEKNRIRVESNRNFAKKLKIGQRATNPETKQVVERTEDYYRVIPKVFI